ncbi:MULTISPECIES: phage tail assembly chaperone G [unclassified Sporosarcina]|uniref:phage tail assembly chaperone G n=1 Tax=unclassified Sporosarcina TaxID=2647733 RepID=UPI00203B44A5|nr:MULTISPECIES: hypothetical protein [unclassified Sporosarcina]GKV67299.1 hypothetical protein NCCP2331_34520 [Sporosarcina sp. NCCP-2331]GLB57640.1 hypothetical protein NCCP2378_34300 [Sporosarcina sp. NCCP-2378]
MSKKIELVIDFESGETKTFHQPAHIKGSVALEGIEIGQAINKKGESDIERSDIERIADFVADQLYGGKFTREELIDGLHAPHLLETLMEQLQSVFGDDTGNFTKEKKV